MGRLFLLILMAGGLYLFYWKWTTGGVMAAARCVPTRKSSRHWRSVERPGDRLFLAAADFPMDKLAKD
jgi:hypothetical protein